MLTKDTIRDLIGLIDQIVPNINNNSDIELIIKQMCSDNKLRNFLLNRISDETGTSILFLDEWSKNLPAEKIKEIFFKISTQLKENLNLLNHPDNTQEIMDGDNFGLVYIPIELFKQVKKLGYLILEFKTNKSKWDDIEKLIVSIMIQSANWATDPPTQESGKNRLTVITNNNPTVKREDLPF